MGTTEEAIVEAAGGAAAALKKIFASRGKLQGNFYYAGDAKGEVGGLVVTLTARDPKGAKAEAQGKPLRKAIPGAKFGRGVVTARGSKLLFELVAGSLSGAQMKTGFKKAFEDDDLKALKAFLRKAIIRAPDLEEEEEEQESAESAPAPAPTLEEILGELEVPASERAGLEQELAALVEEQGDLAARNRELAASFLSAEALQREQQELQVELRRELAALRQAAPPDLAAISEKSMALARVAAEGRALPLPGEPLPEDYRALLDHALDRLAAMSAPTPVSWEAAVQGYFDARDQVQDQLEALRTVLARREDADLNKIGEQGLMRLTEGHRIPLDAALLESRMAADTDKAGVILRAGALAAAFAGHLSSSPAVAATDDNPFGVAVSIQGLLGPALHGLVARAREAAPST